MAVAALLLRRLPFLRRFPVNISHIGTERSKEEQQGLLVTRTWLPKTAAAVLTMTMLTPSTCFTYIFMHPYLCGKGEGRGEVGKEGR